MIRDSATLQKQDSAKLLHTLTSQVQHGLWFLILQNHEILLLAFTCCFPVWRSCRRSTDLKMLETITPKETLKHFQKWGSHWEQHPTSMVTTQTSTYGKAWIFFFTGTVWEFWDYTLHQHELWVLKVILYTRINYSVPHTSKFSPISNVPQVSI